MSKALVLYYSLEGNTMKIAEVIAKSVDADIERITAKEEIKSKGFSKYIWGGSQVVMGKKPEINPVGVNVNEYDIIFVGSPIWAGTFAPPVKTLLEDGHIKGKKIAYFYTHDGGAKKSEEKGKLAINLFNTFIKGMDFMKVKKNFDELSKKAQEWSKEVLRDI